MDTQIGTRPQIGALEMNHVAIEKAEKAKRQKILDLMAKKQDAELESKSYEELAKELEALS